MNDIFSSLDFAAKLDRSKKLSVEIGNDEKNGWDGRELGVGRLWECRVISEASIAASETLLSNKLTIENETCPEDLCLSVRFQKAAAQHVPLRSLSYRSS